MKYNTLGKTGLVISELGLGGAAFGGSYGIDIEFEDGVTVVKKAILEFGINYIDTAPWYGHTRAENIMGKALKGISRDKYVISTKVGRYLPQIQHMFDFSAEKTFKSIDESLERLGIEYVDILMAHDVEFAPSTDIILKETLPALETIKKSGKAKFIGITGYPLELLKYIVENSTVKIDVVLSYCRGTLYDNSLQDYIPFFEERGIGVINASPVGMGLLTERELPKWHPGKQNAALVTACKDAVYYCKDNNVDIVKLVFNFVTKQPGAATTLFSADVVCFVEKNVGYIKDGLSAYERSCLNYILENFFLPHGNALHWEGVEPAKVKRKLKEFEELNGKQ